MYCQQCGKENEDGARFCNGCGIEFVVSAPLVDFPITNTRQRKTRFIILLALVLGGIIAACVGYLAVTTYRSQHASPAYYSQMAGEYYPNGYTDARLRLFEDGHFEGIGLEYDAKQRTWVRRSGVKIAYTGVSGSWSMDCRQIILTSDSYFPGQIVMSVIGNELQDPEGVDFIKR